MSIFLPINTSNSSLFDSKNINQKWNSFLNDLVNILNSKYSLSIDINDFNSIINESLESIYGLQSISFDEKFNSTKSIVKKNNITICKGITSKKTPCKLNAISNSDFCKRHSTQSETKSTNKKSDINEKDENKEEEIVPSSLKSKILDIVKPKKEKASTKLIKATESISLPKKEPFNFKTHKPVNIFDTKFWKVGPFLYDDDKDLLINNTTGLIIETINATEVKLFGRSFEGELILAKDCSEDIIECSITVETDDENEDEDENKDEEEENEE